MATDTASTSENSPSHSLHSKKSFLSPETTEPRAKRQKTDSDITFHRFQSTGRQTDAHAIHQSGKLTIPQPIRRERAKIPGDDSCRTKLIDIGSTDVCFEKPIMVKNSSIHAHAVFDVGESCRPQDRKEECTDGAPPLPVGKQFHIFVSHSTQDKPVVKDNLIVQLRDSCGFHVRACYHFMPDASKYDDKGISEALNNSCVVIIGLSSAYLNSERCLKEYKQAVNIEKERRCYVIVALITECSRPADLKPYLYLDFIDQAKRGAVWTKLLEAINGTLKWMTELKVETIHRERDEKCTPATKAHHHHPDLIKGELLSPLPKEVQALDEVGKASLSGGDTSEIGSSGDSAGDDDQGGGGSGEDDRGGGGSGEDDQGGGGSGEDDRGGGGSVEDYRGGGGSGEDDQGGGGSGEDDQVGGGSGEGVISGKAQWEYHVDEEGRKEGDDAGGVSDDDSESRSKDVEEGEVSGDSSPEKQEENQAHKVTSFYNKLAEPNADKRNESPIYHMRNFNNWVKSILIRAYLPKRAAVLDLCCGKGGDLLKWKEGNIDYLVCADISDASIEHCKGRYYSSKMTFNKQPPYGAEFLVADCSEERLQDKYRNPARRFHLTSCQFSLHYAFESYKKARMMLRNACENLLPGGYFIGTTVDSNELVRKLREAGPSEDGIFQIGNKIFSVRADSTLNLSLGDQNQAVPLFGAKYNFWLHEVVDLPEYLIHMPLLISMLNDFGMEFVAQQNFHDFFTDHRHKPDDLNLLFKMQAFSPETGTISPDQWEVIGLYLVFVFRRKTSGSYY